MFLKFCLQNLRHFEDDSIKCPKQFLYYVSSYVEGQVQKNSDLNFMSSENLLPN